MCQRGRSLYICFWWCHAFWRWCPRVFCSCSRWPAVLRQMFGCCPMPILRRHKLFCRIGASTSNLAARYVGFVGCEAELVWFFFAQSLIFKLWQNNNVVYLCSWTKNEELLNILTIIEYNRIVCFLVCCWLDLCLAWFRFRLFGFGLHNFVCLLIVLVGRFQIFTHHRCPQFLNLDYDGRSLAVMVSRAIPCAINKSVHALKLRSLYTHTHTHTHTRARARACFHR